WGGDLARRGHAGFRFRIEAAPIIMPEWLLSIDDVLFRFVTQSAAWPLVAAFLPLGIVIGCLVAWWAAKTVARESQMSRRLSHWARGAVVLSTGMLFTVLVLAVMRGQQ